MVAVSVFYCYEVFLVVVVGRWKWFDGGCG